MRLSSTRDARWRCRRDRPLMAKPGCCTKSGISTGGSGNWKRFLGIPRAHGSASWTAPFGSYGSVTRPSPCGELYARLLNDVVAEARLSESQRGYKPPRRAHRGWHRACVTRLTWSDEATRSSKNLQAREDGRTRAASNE